MQRTMAASTGSVDQDQDAVDLAALDLVDLLAKSSESSATDLVKLAEKLTKALPRQTRLESVTGAMLNQLAEEAAALAQLGPAIGDLDRILHSPDALHFEPLELGDLLMSILPLWKERATGHSLELALPGEVPGILASVRYAERALHILIETGISLASDGSPIRVSIRPQLDDVLVSVQYSGQPLTKEDAERLFEPFYRREGLPAFRVLGGVGLTLARAILLAHGGRLRIEGSLGVDGSTALVATWPLVPTPPVVPSSARIPTGSHKASGSRMTIGGERPVILVMDSDSRILRYLRANFEVAKYKPVLARNVEEVFQLIDLEEPDLLLLDIAATGQTPAETDEFLLEIQAQVPAPIICLTRENDPVECARVLDLGAVDYVAKPFGLDELLARIRVALRTQQAMSRTPPKSSRFQSGELVIDFGERRVMINDRPVALSKTEFKLLRVLAEHAGMVLPHEALLNRVWGLGYSQEVEFVWVYIRRLRKKIEPDPSAPTYIQTVPGVGYRLVRR
jgi:DNA-binding response OmpR family regulator